LGQELARDAVTGLACPALDDDTYVYELVAAGVAGYVLKDEAMEMVVQAVRAVMQGGIWFSKPIVEKLAQLAAGEAPPDEQPALTKRELEVLKLVAQGYTNIQIGETLSISCQCSGHRRQFYLEKGSRHREHFLTMADKPNLIHAFSQKEAAWMTNRSFDYAARQYASI